MAHLNKIVIVGGGSAGWICAAMLSHYFQNGPTQVELVESEEIGTIGVGESTIPPFLQLIRTLGINEQEFIQETQAAFKLGIRFENWRAKGDVYYHPFGQIGGPLEVNEFYQCWLRAKQNGHPSGLQDFAPATVMADAGKFMLPSKAQRTMIANANYALHIDARLVALYLRRFAEARGVKRTEGVVTDVVTRPDGGIAKVILRDGREAAGDFFIDCSGFRSLLIGKTLGEPFRDWTDVLLCDRAVALQTENVGAPHPYTLAQAQDFGWRWRIPLQHRSGNGYVFCSKYLSDDEAVAALVGQVQGETVLGPTIIPFKTGMRQRLWVRNCVAIGLAGGFIEPLESTALHLIYKGMDYLLRFFPDLDADPTLAAEYNRRMTVDYEEIRDFIVLHYATTKRDDTPFWRAYQQVEIPESLRERIALFKAAGVLRDGVDDMFRAPSWQSVMEGMGVRPDRYQQLVDRIPLSVIMNLMDKSAPMLADFVATLPSHEEFLRTHCPAAPFKRSA
ncbi:tryptophan halogenase family protein [Caulobacter sp. UNC279MFTsu5.1]|uniref:tryptophan halogenase family protein n=1 Tax=Caulobacter sp. UNC279MFTsu5.1 TaxID=1502775 RepID=UPI0008DF1F6B|nr:tryptophan halogenase family protein [Caulobacter sp. UNC279MFTsu5.1]SFJ21517.1 tryptophan halogenase [Caulobacter sp. UNC279MFTsu5.1]